MIELSNETKQLIDAVILEADRERISERLIREAADNIPFCKKSTPKEMERIRFSIIRLIHESEIEEDDIFQLAYIDWRDLFIAAEHGYPGDHEKWARRVIGHEA